jgi:hypothetical protein
VDQAASAHQGALWNQRKRREDPDIVRGSHLCKDCTKGDYLKYCKDYEKYKAVFLKTAKGLQVGAQGELKKP